MNTEANGRLGGRPIGKTEGNFVSSNVLKIYVSHLKRQAPLNWTARQLNFELFVRRTPQDKLSRDSSTFDGLRTLLLRKSIPRLGSDDQLSHGILKAEGSRKFAGGLQILYHPYVQILRGSGSLEELQSLLVLCANSESLKLFRYSAHGATRTMRYVEEEIADVDRVAVTNRQEADTWKDSFLDLVAIAYGLMHESILIRDRDRLEAWRVWFALNRLRFEDWPRGDAEPKKALDRWVEVTLDRSMVEPMSVFQTGFTHLHRHALQSKPVIPEDQTLEDTELRTSGMTPTEEVWVYLALIHGRAPEIQDAAQLAFNRLNSRHYSAPGEYERYLKVRWLDC